MLDQFQGKNQGVLDRSQMNPAQKQKLKRGIAELTSSNIITKIFHSQSSYKINPNILCVISHKQTLSYLINNSVKGIRHTHFLILLTAIEEFFYDSRVKTLNGHQTSRYWHDKNLSRMKLSSLNQKKCSFGYCISAQDLKC